MVTALLWIKMKGKEVDASVDFEAVYSLVNVVFLDFLVHIRGATSCYLLSLEKKTFSVTIEFKK